MNPYVFLRLSGGICVFCSSILFDLFLEQRLRHRYLFFEEMAASLSCLEKEMIGHRLLLPQALEKAAGCCQNGPQNLFQYAAKNLSENNGTFQQLWQEAVRICNCRDLFSKEEYRLLCHVSDALCQSDVILQRTLLTTYQQQFLQLGSDAKQICLEKSRLYRRLLPAAGLFLILLLL